MSKTTRMLLGAMGLLAFVSATVEAQILPTKLGTSSNCSSSYGTAINNASTASPLQVAAQGSGSTDGQARALLWTASTGMIDLGLIAAARGGSTEGISNEGTAATSTSRKILAIM